MGGAGERPAQDLDAELRRLWADGIEQVDAALISPELPEETRSFLAGFGLPTRDTDIVEFYHDERLITPYVRGDRIYLPIGDDGTALYVLESHTGEVYDLYPRRDEVHAFLNSDIGSFLFFVGRYLQTLPGLVENLPEQDEPSHRYQTDLAALREELAGRDLRALSHSGHWWVQRFAAAEVGEP